jgi:RNA polymerase sigma factor FliA
MQNQPKDSPAVMALIHEGLAMVEPIARRVSRTMGRASDLDDAIAYGRKGVLEAARRYDPDAGYTFRAFASQRIQGAVIDGMRETAAVPRRANEKLSDTKPDGRVRLLLASMATARANGLLAQPAFDTHGEHTAVSPLATGEEATMQRAVLGILERGIQLLPPAEARIVSGHYLEGLQLVQLAKELGFSEPWVGRLHTRALERLAQLLAVDFKSRT